MSRDSLSCRKGTSDKLADAAFKTVKTGFAIIVVEHSFLDLEMQKSHGSRGRALLCNEVLLEETMCDCGRYVIDILLAGGLMASLMQARERFLGQRRAGGSASLRVYETRQKGSLSVAPSCCRANELGEIQMECTFCNRATDAFINLMLCA